MTPATEIPEVTAAIDEFMALIKGEEVVQPVIMQEVTVQPTVGDIAKTIMNYHTFASTTTGTTPF